MADTFYRFPSDVKCPQCGQPMVRRITVPPYKETLRCPCCGAEDPIIVAWRACRVKADGESDVIKAFKSMANEIVYKRLPQEVVEKKLRHGGKGRRMCS